MNVDAESDRPIRPYQIFMLSSKFLKAASGRGLLGGRVFTPTIICADRKSLCALWPRARSNASFPPVGHRQIRSPTSTSMTSPPGPGRTSPSLHTAQPH
jgi:hypothetical protein